MNVRFIRKALATASAIAIAFVAVVIPSSPVVSAAQWWEPYNEALFELNVVDSLGSLFRAGDNVTRAEQMTMIDRIMLFSADADTLANPGFTDVPESAWFYDAVAAGKEYGIIQGTTATTFSPERSVNRAEAAKMIALAFDIPTSNQGTPFTDVPAGSWFAPYVEALYVNSVVDGIAGGNTFDPSAPITRAAMAKMLSLAIVVAEGAEGEYARISGVSAFAGLSDAQIVALVTGGEMPDDTVVPPTDTVSSSSLSVGLASNTPVATTIPTNGFNVPYTYLNFSAGPEEGVKVTGLTITRTGLGAAGNFTNVKLYDGLAQISSEKTLSSQHNTATFNLNSTPVMVAAGGTKTVRLLADMANPGAGVSNQLGIASANDVTAVGVVTGGAVSARGSFPIYGAPMATSAVNVGTLTYEITDPHGAAASTFYIGDMDRVGTRINLSTATEDMDVMALTFRQEGSATSDEIANITLYHQGQAIAGPAQMVDRFVTLELDSPLFVERGSSVTFEIRFDVVGGYNHTVGFDIYRDWHITAVGRVYGFPVRVTEGAGSNTITSDNITGSRLSFSAGPENPTTGDVKPNAKDFVGLQFNIINTGDIVDIRNLPIAIETNGAISPSMLSDVKIWRLDANNNFVQVVAGPIEPTDVVVGNDEVLVFTDVFEVEANTTAKFAVTYDLSNTAPAATGNWVRTHVINAAGAASCTTLIACPGATNGFEVRNVATGDIIYNNANAPATTFLSLDTSGNARTVANPTLSFTVASAPQTDAYVKNATNVPVVAFNAKAGSADDLNITALNLTLTQDNAANVVRTYTCQLAGVTPVADTDLKAVKLYADIDGVETLLDGPREVSGGVVNFTGFQLTVPAGETVRILVRSDVPSSAQTQVCPSFRINANSDVTANDSDGRSLSSTTQITAANTNGAANAPTAYILVAASGKLRITAANNTPNAGQVIAGATDVPVAKIEFTASTVENVEIQKFRLFNTTDVTNNTDDAVKTVKLYDGDTLIATGMLTNGYVTWENLGLVIPRNSSKIITVSVDFNDSATINNIAGMAPRFVVRNLEDNWVDNSTAGRGNGVGSQSTTTVGQNGDVKAVGKSSGQLLLNTGVVTDAIAGDRGYATGVTDNSICDSAGYVNGNVETTPGNADVCLDPNTEGYTGVGGVATVAVTGTKTEAQYVYNTKLTLSLEGGTDGTPVGNQGSAAGAGDEVTIFKFRVAAAANSTANNPREVVIRDLYFTVSGDAEANNFKLYGPSDMSNAMATSTVVHRTNTIGSIGAAAANHATQTTVVPFTSLTGTDSKITYGQSKVYTLKANVYAITDNNSPVRSLRVFLDNYGTFAGGSDVVWLDNGVGSAPVYWVHEVGKDELRPTSPMTYNTSSSYITATPNAPVFVSSRALGTDSVEVFYTFPLDLAPAGNFAVNAGAGAVGATVANITGNKVSISGGPFGINYGVAVPTVAESAAGTGVQAVGSLGTTLNTPAAVLAPTNITQNF